jgi:cysteine sulfinate desulfinase/cysteine desulfurase-like protein
VAEAVATTMRTAVGNRTTVFEPGRRSNRIVEAARAAVADLVGGDPRRRSPSGRARRR